jgi:hypothetical protein
MMRVWLVIIEDPHLDVHVRVWMDREAALEQAKMRARELDRSDQLEEKQGSEELTRGMLEAGWVYFATTGPDGATIKVTETTTCGPWPQGSIGG